ncbi:MAG: sigma-70 family RNA polymerase sigma factor [Deltaproteobacteria bacterium]|nr:sigma-70 family RNA polymerase sigma factor [Deltaproteobacteria bacterium]MBK8713851.1 sigma-70 family RNA polymerase sigma factor [Deltaproteobacteria bacterium]
MDSRAVFCAALTPELRAKWQVSDELEAQLDAAWARALAAFPGIAAHAHAFLQHLAAVVDAEVLPALARLDLEGLALAFAGARGLDGAADTLLRLHQHDLRLALVRAGLEGDAAHEVRQRVLVKLFGATAHLASYRGRGDFGAWLKSVTVREAMTWRRRSDAREQGDEREIAAADVLGTQPEESLIKGLFGDRVVAALRDAIAVLEPDDRALLRNRFVDRLTLDQLALVHGAHRATVARWLARLRDTLAEGIRTRLITEPDLAPEEFERWVGWARSRIEFSLGGLIDDASRG